jgi:hypothetical protein
MKAQGNNLNKNQLAVFKYRERWSEWVMKAQETRVSFQGDESSKLGSGQSQVTRVFHVSYLFFDL